MKASHVNVRLALTREQDEMGRTEEFIASAFYALNVRVQELILNARSNSIEIVKNRSDLSNSELLSELEAVLNDAVQAIPRAARPKRCGIR